MKIFDKNVQCLKYPLLNYCFWILLGTSIPHILAPHKKLLPPQLLLPAAVHRGDSDVISSYHIYASCFSAICVASCAKCLLL